MATHEVMATSYCQHHTFITESELCTDSTHSDHKVLYWVTGEYGYIHTTMGSRRFWNTRSGANRWIKKNV